MVEGTTSYTYYTKEGKYFSKNDVDTPWNKLHREDGPAVIWDDGQIEWYIDGKLHKLDGPAVHFKNGGKGYYISGKRLDEEEVETWIKENNINLKTKQHQVLFMVKFG